jgi:carbon monoxide dehydrogenase subunit G
VVELDHQFQTGKPADYNLEAVTDLERVIPCVEGGSVLERTGDDEAKAEIKVKMGAMSMTFRGTVTVVSKDTDSALLRVKSRDTGGSGHANADVTFTLHDGGGNVHTAAQISGKAASMGEGVVQSVLDALIKDFTTKLAQI